MIQRKYFRHFCSLIFLTAANAYSMKKKDTKFKTNKKKIWYMVTQYSVSLEMSAFPK